MLCGMDLGSRNVKIAICPADISFDKGFFQDFSSLEFRIYNTIDFYRRYAHSENNRVSLDLKALGFPENTLLYACGYGRQAAALANAVPISEIQAHAYGAMAQTLAKDFLLLDLGGQDSKIIQVKGGKIADFSANDKCAAGSGRYLENMAEVLGISLEELSKAKENPVLLSSTCAVFGESELIGKIIEGHPLANLAAGVNYSLIRRLIPLINRHLPSPEIFFSGGVAQNDAIIYLLEKELNQKVEKLSISQYNGALGCCVYGSQTLGDKA